MLGRGRRARRRRRFRPAGESFADRIFLHSSRTLGCIHVAARGRTGPGAAERERRPGDRPSAGCLCPAAEGAGPGDRRPARRDRAAGDLPVRPRPCAVDGRAGAGQDAAGQQAGRDDVAEVQPHPVHARPDADGHHRHRHPPGHGRTAGGSSSSSTGRSSPTSSWPTRSTAPRRRPRRPCSRRCRNTTSPCSARSFHLEPPFLVLATQNPVEQEGTYPLPEAQLDRFMFLIELDYPVGGRGDPDRADDHGRGAAALDHLMTPAGDHPAPEPGAPGAGAGPHLLLRGPAGAQDPPARLDGPGVAQAAGLLGGRPARRAVPDPRRQGPRGPARQLHGPARRRPGSRRARADAPRSSPPSPPRPRASTPRRSSAGWSRRRIPSIDRLVRVGSQCGPPSARRRDRRSGSHPPLADQDQHPMFPDRQPRSFLDTAVLSRLAGFPLFARRPMLGIGLGPASQPAPRLERRVRRVSQVRPGRRPPPARLAGLRPVGPVLRQGVRGRYQPALLPGARHQRLDGLRLDGRHQDRVRPADRRGASATWRSSKATRSACPAWPTGSSATSRRGAIPSHLMAVFDVLEQAKPQGETQLVPVLHELAETISPAGLDRHHLRPVRRARGAARLLPAPAVPQARRGGLPPARPAGAELRLPPADAVPRHGRRARRSSPSPTRSPSATTRRSAATSSGLQQVVLESAVDYHRVSHRRRLTSRS